MQVRYLTDETLQYVWSEYVVFASLLGKDDRKKLKKKFNEFVVFQSVGALMDMYYYLYERFGLNSRKFKSTILDDPNFYEYSFGYAESRKEGF